MPTGYTAKLVESGQTFEEFVWTCARAFGALVMMRDDPSNAPISEKSVCEEDAYYVNGIKKYESELAALTTLPEPEMLARGEKMKIDAIKSAEASLQRCVDEDRRINDMIASVTAWEAPTKDHVQLKEFMLEQLRISQSGMVDYYKKDIASLKRRTSMAFMQDAIDSVKRSLENSREHLSKVKQRNGNRMQWIQSLDRSVPMPASVKGEGR